MAAGAKVISIEIIRDFRAALASFAEDARMALSEAGADVQRTLWWVQHDQLAHWQREIKKRNDKVQQAKSDLYKAQLASRDERPSCVIERKALAKAQAALDEATDKLAKVKRWALTLEKEMMLFRGQCQQLAHALDGDVPNALARLERMTDALQAYLSLSAPTPDGALAATASVWGPMGEASSASADSSHAAEGSPSPASSEVSAT
jgi:hypothetical protein